MVGGIATAVAVGPAVLRDYQREAIAVVGRNVAAKIKRTLLVAPTGSGKGTIAAVIIARAYRQGRPVMFVVHRKEILDEIWRRTLAEGVPAHAMGMIRGDDPRRNPAALVQFASIDSLRGKVLPRAEILLIDECHRIQSRTYTALLAEYTDAIVIGFTATPMRLDGKSLKGPFQALHIVALPSQLIKGGFILRPDMWSAKLEDEPDISAVRITSGVDYNLADLAFASDKAVIRGSIVGKWLEKANNRITIVSAVNVTHSKNIVAEFQARGVAAEHLDGTMAPGVRDKLIADFRAGKIRVLSQCEILLEGFDAPECKCIIMARRTLSLTIYLQLCGRAMRPRGEEEMLILDHVGNWRLHGRPDMDRDWREVFNHKRKKGTGAAITKQCPACYTPNFGGARACVKCEHVFEFHDATQSVDGELVAVPLPSEDEQRAAMWAHWCDLAHENGDDLEWVRYRFREFYNEAPPADYVFLEPKPVEYTPEELEAGLRKFRAIAYRQGKDMGWVAWKFRQQFGCDPPAAKAFDAQALHAAEAAAAPMVQAAPPPTEVEPRWIEGEL